METQTLPFAEFDQDSVPVVATTPELVGQLRAGAAVALGVSGGKDSHAAGIAMKAYLDEIGHAGPRLLIHSDLGMVEWRHSLPACRDLAEALGMELVVVRRRAGGLMERWESRWESSVRRYGGLETVTLVLPWSTPSMRFCTSELKTHIILPELRRRFRGLPVINATGVRRAESRGRAHASVANWDVRGSTKDTPVMHWRPIVDWTEEQVFAEIRAAGLTPHPAYTTYGTSRVSCCFCIMSSLDDLRRAAQCEDNAPLFRRMVALETTSTFAFQGTRWLADVAPSLLTDAEYRASLEARERAAARVAAEREIPKELRFVRGWPTRMISAGEAALLASVRRRVAEAVGVDADFLDAESIRARYATMLSGGQQSCG